MGIAKCEVVRVGQKGRHLAVLDGWQLVSSGKVLKDDKFANLMTIVWQTVDADDIGQDVSDFDFIIRKA